VGNCKQITILTLHLVTKLLLGWQKQLTETKWCSLVRDLLHTSMHHSTTGFMLTLNSSLQWSVTLQLLLSLTVNFYFCQCQCDISFHMTDNTPSYGFLFTHIFNWWIMLTEFYRDPEILHMFFFVSKITLLAWNYGWTRFSR
jgi:hypothetical protein